MILPFSFCFSEETDDEFAPKYVRKKRKINPDPGRIGMNREKETIINGKSLNVKLEPTGDRPISVHDMLPDPQLPFSSSRPPQRSISSPRFLNQNTQLSNPISQFSNPSQHQQQNIHLYIYDVDASLINSYNIYIRNATSMTKNTYLYI